MSSTRKIETCFSIPEEIIQNVPLGGRIYYSLQSCERLAKDQEISEIVKEYKIPLLSTPAQKKEPLNTPLKLDSHLQEKFVLFASMKAF